MLSRREFLGSAAALAVWPKAARLQTDGVLVNDVHSQLNETRVAAVASVSSVEEVRSLVTGARAQGRSISIAAGRHAMGGQQFGGQTLLVDMNGLQRVLAFDADRGLIEVESGIQWPAIVDHLLRAQEGRERQWGIIQKQTGADRLSMGGALAANVHGRGLRLKPIVGDVESFVLVDADGEVRTCSRTRNAPLFGLAIGGYGLFGVISSVTLRLAPRRKVERIVEVIDVDRFMPAVEQRIADGYLFGDFQYMTDEKADGFLSRGVFSCYRPVDDARSMQEGQKELSAEDWNRLFYLSHADKARAFEAYASYYLSTSGQVYWSDTHQLSLYLDGYHAALDASLGGGQKATEMITEIYVPRARLGAFLGEARRQLRESGTNVIYGTIRLIEKDDESFLAWARESWACTIFNLHVVHSPDGLARAADAFRGLIDLAIAEGGSYFLTYHRWAHRAQVLACYPQFPEFLTLKRQHDPQERFQSDWYRHYREMFA